MCIISDMDVAQDIETIVLDYAIKMNTPALPLNPSRFPTIIKQP
jgi:hypothetical protein